MGKRDIRHSSSKSNPDGSVLDDILIQQKVQGLSFQRSTNLMRTFIATGTWPNVGHGFGAALGHWPLVASRAKRALERPPAWHRASRKQPSVLSRARFENRFDGLVEEAGDTEGEREAGVIFTSFNCVHGLARHVETSSKVCL